MVSAQRSTLGAVQNRLEHTINNLDNIVENTTSAESEIRDTDMAEEMVEYSKNNILAQAGQSMLAQANQATQGVMNLLQ
jgi:flagellin